MARLRKSTLMAIGNALLIGAKRRLIPRGLAFSALGLLLPLLGEKQVPFHACYAPIPPEQPVVIKASVIPNPTRGAGRIFVSAVLVNPGGRPITGGRFFFMANPSGESDTSMVDLRPIDGFFDSDSENVYCLFDLPKLSPASYPFFIIGYSGPGGGERYGGYLEVTEE